MKLELRTASLEDPRVVYSLIRVHVEENEAKNEDSARRPVNLALVIDASSSMRGPRIAQAIRAAQSVVERLQDTDRLGVVAFDSSVRVLMPSGPVTPESTDRLLAALEKIRTSAGTNLAAGWKKGCEMVAAGFLRDAITRVILLTDGQPSVGIRNAEKLMRIAKTEAQRGVNTTAMGLGEGFDDELLAEIARCGRGGFYYLATPESIAAAFGRELAGVFSIAATDVQLRIVPELDVFSLEVLHRVITRPQPNGLTVELGEIAVGAPRQVLLKMIGSDTRAGRLMAKLAVTYTSGHGQPGEPHLNRLVLPETADKNAIAHIAHERLRIAAVIAIDEAWARRASGQREEAIAALADVRSAIAGARERGLARADALLALEAELATTKAALASRARNPEHMRRAARERSHVTLLGHSVIEPPADP